MSASAAIGNRAGKGWTDDVRLSGRKKLILIGSGMAVAFAAGGWLFGILPGLLYGKKHLETAKNHKLASAAEASAYVECPKMIAGFDSRAREAAHIRLKTKLGLARKEGVAVARNGMPRMVDLVQDYLRETCLEELRGTAGTYRLREEPVRRTGAAVVPARVVDVPQVEV